MSSLVSILDEQIIRVKQVLKQVADRRRELFVKVTELARHYSDYTRKTFTATTPRQSPI